MENNRNCPKCRKNISNEDENRLYLIDLFLNLSKVNDLEDVGHCDLCNPSIQDKITQSLLLNQENYPPKPTDFS